MRERFFQNSYILIWFSIAFAVGIIAFAALKPILVLPRIAFAPGFALIDQNDHLFSSEALRGQIVLYNFTYSRCQPPCQQTSPVMYTLQQQLAETEMEGPAIKLVTISLDAWDTPEHLHHYANRLGADLDRWHFVTGKPKILKQVVGGGFNTYYAVDHTVDSTTDETVSIFYEPAFILVDGWGVQRAEYRTAQPALEILWRDINLLINEAQNSTGVMRYGYEAAHLFLCYP